MDFMSWGNAYSKDSSNWIVYDSDKVYKISLFDDYQIVELEVEGKTILKFKDVKHLSDEMDTFTRFIEDNHEYRYLNGKIVLELYNQKVDYMLNTIRSIYLTDDFLTMKIGTRKISNKWIPYCVSLFDGKNTKSFYISNYRSIDEMLKSAIQYLMRRKYRNYKIYFHNLSGYDGVYLLRVLSSISDHIRDGKILDIRVTFFQNIII